MEIGLSKDEFRAHFEHFLRINGRMSSKEFAERYGELESAVNLVRSGDIEPTATILRAMDWVRFDHGYYAKVLVQEARYMPRRDSVKRSSSSDV